MPVSPSQLLLLVAGLSPPSPAWGCTWDSFCAGPIAGGGNTCLKTQGSACRPLIRPNTLSAPDPGEFLGRVGTCARTHTRGVSGCCDHFQLSSGRRTQSRGGSQTPCLVTCGRPCSGPGALADHMARIQVHGCPPASLLITGRGKGPGQ